MSGPWTIDQAKDAARQASTSQRAAENFIREAFKQFALSEEKYRTALAVRITELHAEASRGRRPLTSPAATRAWRG
jgi:hypothetical protein